MISEKGDEKDNATSPFNLTFDVDKDNQSTITIKLNEYVRSGYLEIVLDSPDDNYDPARPAVSLTTSALDCQLIGTHRENIRIAPTDKLNVIRRLIARKASTEFPYEFNHYIRFFTYVCKINQFRAVTARDRDAIFLTFTKRSTLCDVKFYGYDAYACSRPELPLSIATNEKNGVYTCAEGFSELKPRADRNWDSVGDVPYPSFPRRRTVCLENGSWSDPQPVCKPIVTCPIDHFNESIFHVELTHASYFNQTQIAIKGTQANYYCRDLQVEISGNQTFICKANGQWSNEGKEPRCVAKTTKRVIKLSLFHAILFAAFLVLIALIITSYYAYRIHMNRLRELALARNSKDDRYGQPPLLPKPRLTLTAAEPIYSTVEASRDSHRDSNSSRYTRVNSFRTPLQTVPEERDYEACHGDNKHYANAPDAPLYADTRQLRKGGDYDDVHSSRRSYRDSIYDGVVQEDELYLKVIDEPDKAGDRYAHRQSNV